MRWQQWTLVKLQSCRREECKLAQSCWKMKTIYLKLSRYMFYNPAIKVYSQEWHITERPGWENSLQGFSSQLQIGNILHVLGKEDESAVVVYLMIACSDENGWTATCNRRLHLSDRIWDKREKMKTALSKDSSENLQVSTKGFHDSCLTVKF